jgi:hypothetical protein
MAAFNQTRVSTLVAATIDAARKYGEKIDDLRKALPASLVLDTIALTIALRPSVAEYYGLGVSDHGKTGGFTLPEKLHIDGTPDSKHPKMMAARQALSKMVTHVIGPVVKHTEEKRVRPTPEERAAYDKMTKAIAVFKATCGKPDRVAAVTKALKA